MNLIALLRDYPLVGFMIGLLFVSIMFAAKNVIIYLYSKQQQK